MPALEVGRVCIKLKGREAGRKARIVEVGKEFIIVEGPYVRKRPVNPRHVLLTQEMAKAAEFAFKGKAGAKGAKKEPQKQPKVTPKAPKGKEKEKKKK